MAGMTLWTLERVKKTRNGGKVLVLGLGSGALPSFLSNYAPQLQIDVVEVSEEVFRCARDFFGLNDAIAEDNFTVHLCCALDFVEKAVGEGREYDAIILDVCTNHEVPDNLLVPGFFRNIRTLLEGSDKEETRRNGMLAAYLGPSAERGLSIAYDVFKGHSVYLLAEDHLREGRDEFVVVVDINTNQDISVSGWDRVMGGDSSGAMPVADAQRTEVVRIPGFLSLSEIESIHEAAKEAAALVGREVRSDDRQNVGSEMWHVLHLNTDGMFDKLLPKLRSKLEEAVRGVDSSTWGLIESVCGCNERPMTIRVAEYHKMKAGGSLSDPRHYDLDSLVTVDMMLASRDNFQGGVLETLECDGTLKQHTFEQGDALFFVSHKYHRVTPVTEGLRCVLVVEFWAGDEKYCPHRCQALRGQCITNQSSSYMDQKEAEVDGVHGNVGTGATEPGVRLPFRLGSTSSEFKVLAHYPSCCLFPLSF